MHGFARGLRLTWHAPALRLALTLLGPRESFAFALTLALRPSPTLGLRQPFALRLTLALLDPEGWHLEPGP